MQNNYKDTSFVKNNKKQIKKSNLFILSWRCNSDADFMHAVTAVIWIKKQNKTKQTNKGFKKHNVQETVVELNKIVHDKAEKFIKLLVYFTTHWLFVIVTHQVCWVGKQGVTMAH